MTAQEATEALIVLPYGDRRIDCDVRRSSRRSNNSVAIHVEPDGRVLIEAPLHATASEIRSAASRRVAWIYRRLAETEERRRGVAPREYVSGETVFYLGRRFRLKVFTSDSVASSRIRSGYLEVTVRDRSPELVRAELEKWYRYRAKEVLPQRLYRMSDRLKWVATAPQVSIRPMSRQWGSCSPLGRISLNVALIRVPPECIDYVLLHELTHLREHNHGPEFYRILSRHLPDWKRVKTRLDSLAELALAK